MPRDRAVRHLEADEPPRGAGRAHLLDRVLADEVTLLRLHDPSEAGLERVRRLVDVVAVERVRHLEAERIAGAEADRRDTIMAARVEQRIPEPFGGLGGNVQLEAVLARVSRARDDRRDARHARRREAIVRDRRDVGLRQPTDERLGARSLHRDQTGRRRDVLPARAAGMPGHPRPVLVDVRRVHRQHEAIARQARDRQVVDDAALRRAENRVLNLADVERAHVVRGQRLERRERALTVDLELAHVAHVEEAHRRAHRAMLLQDSAILHGHVPPAEFHHSRARFDMGVVERSSLERGVHGRSVDHRRLGRSRSDGAPS